MRAGVCPCQTQGFSALGSSGLGPSPALAASSANFVPPPPPLPAHLSWRDSDATRSQRFTVDVNGQLRNVVVDEYGILRVLPEQESGVPSGYRVSGEGVSQTARVRDQVQSLERTSSPPSRGQRGQGNTSHARSTTPSAPYGKGTTGHGVEISPKTPMGTKVACGPPPITPQEVTPPRPPPLPDTPSEETAGLNWLKRPCRLPRSQIQVSLKR